MTRTSIVVLYVAAVLAIALFVVRGNGGTAVGYGTTRPLGANHRIVAGDLRVTPGYQRGWDPSGITIRDLDGRYVASAHPSPGPIKLEDLTHEPHLVPPNAGTSVLWLPRSSVSPPDVLLLEPGLSVDVCGAKCESVAVAAQWCDPKAPATCLLGVWVTSDKRRQLFTILDSTTRTPKQTLRIVSHLETPPPPKIAPHRKDRRNPAPRHSAPKHAASKHPTPRRTGSR